MNYYFCNNLHKSIDLFIGSEGIFGLFSEITIRLEKVGQETISDLAFFDNENDALAYVNALRPLKNKGILALESELKTVKNEFLQKGILLECP